MGPRLHTHTNKAASHHYLDLPLANTQLHSAFSLPLGLASTKSSHQSTRVQLQQQRILEEQQQYIQQQQLSTAGIDIGLSYPHSATTVLVGKAIPGFKTSAAFFASLRTNLRLHASPPLASPLVTPNSLRPITGPYFPPSSPLATPADLTTIMDPIPTSSSPDDQPAASSLASQPPNTDDPLAGVPDLQTYAATTDSDRTDALKLVADAVAQQRQVANTVLISHPLNISVAIGLFAVVARVLSSAGYDTAIIATTCAGVLMSLLLVCRVVTQDFLTEAEKINFKWLGDDTEVLVTKFGEEIIGTVMVDWVANGNGGKRKKNRHGLIRAWAVRLRYRGKGVGSALLEDVVREAKKKSAETVEFDPAHAYSKRFLPNIYNSAFNKQESKASNLLQELLNSNTGRGKRK